MRRLTISLLLLVPALAAPSVSPAPAEGPPRPGLQALIDATPTGGTLVLEAGEWAGPAVLDRSMVLDGRGVAILVGDGLRSVVEVSGAGVTIRGLTIRRSGRDTSAEAAGIKASGDGHRFLDNRVEDVYFGIHLSDGADNEIRGNTITPGESDRVRPGHAVSLWYQRRAVVADNVMSEARDGVYLSFADDALIAGNTVTGSRYGVHSMYSARSTFENNHLESNLVGTALMYSDGLRMRCNTIERHREGATAYAILLKDIDDLALENNRLIDNRVGIYADNTPLGRDAVARVRGNLIAAGDTALVLQSTARLTFVGNTVADNLTVVRAEGGRLGANRWFDEAGGNHWDDYAGFDGDGDGLGDLPYRYESVFDELVARTPALRAFLYTPAHLALERAARAFPVIPRAPLVLDERPLMTAPSNTCTESVR